MSDLFLIRPSRPGMKIFDPDIMGFLPDEGSVRARTPHWVGQEMHGDVTITPIPDGAEKKRDEAIPSPKKS